MYIKAVFSDKVGVQPHRDCQVQGQGSAFDRGNCPVPRPSFSKQCWRRSNSRHAEQKRVHQEAKSCIDKKIAALTKSQLKQGVLNGTITSAAWDMARTSNTGKDKDPYIQTDKLSTKVFSMADCHPTPASNVDKLHHPIRGPACTVDMVPALADQSLLSGGNSPRQNIFQFVMVRKSTSMMAEQSE